MKYVVFLRTKTNGLPISESEDYYDSLAEAAEHINSSISFTNKLQDKGLNIKVLAARIVSLPDA